MENLNNKHAMRVLLSIGYTDLQRASVYISNNEPTDEVENIKREILKKSDLNMVTWMQGYTKNRLEKLNISVIGYSRPLSGYMLTEMAITVIALKELS